MERDDWPPDKADIDCVEEDVCPVCDGNLDIGWKCNVCGYDAWPIYRDYGKAFREHGPISGRGS